MAKPQTKETFKAWVEDTLKRLPEDKQEAFRNLIADEDLANPLFGGFLRESDYYQRVETVAQERKRLESEMQEVEGTKAKLLNWYKENAPVYENTLSENEKLKASKALLEAKLKEISGETLPEPRAEDAPPRNTRELEELRSRLATMDQVLPQFIGKMSSIVKRSIEEGFDIDPEDVINYSVKNGVDPMTAFDALTYDRRVEKYNAGMEEQKKKWKEEGRKEALSSLSTPDSINRPGPNPIFDSLASKTSVDPRQRVDTAVAKYLEIRDQS